MAAKKTTKNEDWAAGFFSAKELDAFHEIVGADLRRRKITFELGPGVVQAIVDKKKTPWGLTNLAQDCKTLPRAKWKARVAHHFDSLLEVGDMEKELGERTKDFSEAAKLLKVRLHPFEWLENVDPKKQVYTEPATGFVAALVFDLPKAVIGVSPRETKAWGKRVPELFELGIANVESEGLLPTTDVELDDGLRAVGLQGADSFFVATHAFFLGRYMKKTPERGTLVTMPTRGTALFHPIAGPKSEKAIMPMLEIASGLFQQGPGAVTPFLYHLTGGTFSLIEMDFKKRDVKLHYPKSLVRALS